MSTAKRRLKTARHRRSQVASLFASLHDHTTTLPDVLGRPPACLGHIRIFDVLRRAPGLRDAGADKVLKDARVWPTTTVGNLSREELDRICDHLPPRAKKGGSE